MTIAIPAAPKFDNNGRPIFDKRDKFAVSDAPDKRSRPFVPGLMAGLGAATRASINTTR